MEVDTIFKILFGGVSALGTIALIVNNFGQSQKVKAELLEKFRQAISESDKHAATEIFRLIHGLRMSYTDIVALTNNDNCSKIIYALKKTPGLVTYNNGEFCYTSLASNSFFKFIKKWSHRLILIVLGIVMLFSYGFMVMGDGFNSVAGAVLLMISSMLFALQLRQKKFDQMISNIVESNSEGRVKK